MIIHSIHASNVLKYAKLDLDNLPEKGKIAISGANESGKTAIVETISFALFGQTFSNDMDNVTRNIRWGESSCSVELVFTGSGDISYTVFRSCDKQGMHSAELFKTGEDTPFASGPLAVQDEITKVCGFDFVQYLDSLYLAQMEITSSASQAKTIKAISGAAPIEAVRDDLKYEISVEHDSIAAIEQEQNRIREQIESLSIDEDRLSAIETEKQQFAEQVDVYKEEIKTIQNTSINIREAGTHIQESGHTLSVAGSAISVNQWQEHLTSVADSIETMRESVSDLEMESELRSGGELKKYTGKLQSRLTSFEAVQEQGDLYRAELGAQMGEHNKKPDDGSMPLPKQRSSLMVRLLSQRFYRGFMQVLGMALILVTILLWSCWGLLVQAPDSAISTSLTDLLNQLPSWWDMAYLKNIAIGSLLITVLVLFMSTRVKSRITQNNKELVQINERLQVVKNNADLLDNINDRPLPELIDGLHNIDSKPFKMALEHFTENEGNTFLSEELFADHQQQLNALLDDNTNKVAELRETIATQVGKLTSLSDEQHEKSSKLDREVDDIRARQKEVTNLEMVIDNMGPSLNEHRQRIQVREVALKLATGACSNIYGHFDRVLSKYTAIVMPKLTDGRYKQIQIDDDLTVQVFSTEKNDFAALDELSSGTQRQIMLAVRLAISKALVEAGQQGKQFIILDEPFAFFDRERIRNTIKSLNGLDKNVTQFWILTQEFESQEEFELAIDCSRDSDELTIAG